MRMETENGGVEMTRAEYLILAKATQIEAKIGALFDVFIATMPSFSIPNETITRIKEAKDKMFKEFNDYFDSFLNLLSGGSKNDKN